MIIPWLKGFLSREQAPLTWTLILLNVFIFLMTYNAQPNTVEHVFLSSRQFEMTAKLYYQYTMKNKGTKALPAYDDLSGLGLKALRDINFINNADRMNFYGDQVAIKDWKKNIVNFRDDLESRDIKTFGLSYQSKKPLTWITYQFMHAGFLHLFSNMLMLIIFGGALESLIGGLGVITVYILSGLAGAAAFLILGAPSMAAMVGASGSLSGIMACYMVYERKKSVPFFYFLSPIEGFYGWLWLPTWTIFPLFFVGDIAAYFGTSSLVGSGVAYTAHIGGMLFGVGAGVVLKNFRSSGVLRSKPTSHRIF